MGPQTSAVVKGTPVWMARSPSVEHRALAAALGGLDLEPVEPVAVDARDRRGYGVAALVHLGGGDGHQQRACGLGDFGGVTPGTVRHDDDITENDQAVCAGGGVE